MFYLKKKKKHDKIIPSLAKSMYTYIKLPGKMDTDCFILDRSILNNYRGLLKSNR